MIGSNDQATRVLQRVQLGKVAVEQPGYLHAGEHEAKSVCDDRLAGRLPPRRRQHEYEQRAGGAGGQERQGEQRHGVCKRQHAASPAQHRPESVGAAWVARR